MLAKSSVLDVSVTTASRKQILLVCASVFARQSRTAGSFPLTIVTPNAEQIVLARDNQRFLDILNEADIALPDGKPLEWILEKHTPAVKRISGIDFVSDLCRLAADRHGRVLLVGGSGGIAAQALANLRAQFPGLDGIAEDGPDIEASSIPDTLVDSLVHIIRGRNVRIVFLGFGAPKQEYLMDALVKRLKGERVILMVVGGSFDVIAGRVKRAPEAVQSLGLEWLWRLIGEPWRWRRQLALFRFVILLCTNQPSGT